MNAEGLVKMMILAAFVIAAPYPAGASITNTEAAGSASDCPLIFPVGPVAVAPDQRAVPEQSTTGIINALCEITLNFVGCGFIPTSVALNCDTNGDGVAELLIPLKDITVFNRLLFRATLPALTTTPGTAFPLSCCGGTATITLTCTLAASDDNVFGPITQSITCPIDLGIRAPTVISATPSEGDCALGQNVLIPGSCFLLADGKPNVTSVFAVEAGNPANVIQASSIQILTGNLIDAFFEPAPANAGKSFLIFVSGPNGTSRNLTTLPAGAPANCPLGNEQGIAVKLKCKSGAAGGSGANEDSTATAPLVSACQVDRDEAGAYSLSIFGRRFRDGAAVVIEGKTPKRIKFRDPDQGDGTFAQITVKRKFCGLLPGEIVITNPDGTSSAPMICLERCFDQ